MGFENGNYNYDTDQQNIEQQVGFSTNEANQIGEKINSSINQIRQNERIEESFGELIGQNFEKGTIEFMYMNINGEKGECMFDIEEQTIEYKGQKFKIDLSSGASITKISFLENEIKIDGKLGWFSGSGTAGYDKLLSSLDELFKLGKTKIASSGGDINMYIV